MQTNLRTATIDDLYEINELLETAPHQSWSISSLRPEFDHQRARFRAIFTQGTSKTPPRLIGVCLGWMMVDELHILNVVVHPRFQRKGLAKQLLEDVCQLAREENAERICLEVRESNVPAIGLYNAFGFEQVGRRKQYYKNPREDALLFDLQL
mgnify:CR=1 FL=1